MSYNCDECGKDMHIEKLPGGCSGGYCSRECSDAKKLRECTSWISVKDRLPPDDFEDVIVRYSDTTVDTGFYAGYGVGWHLVQLDRVDSEITHWLTMPKGAGE